VSETTNQRHDVLDKVLRFGAGFKDEERPWAREALSALVPHVALESRRCRRRGLGEGP
jgi:hypothetical protein